MGVVQEVKDGKFVESNSVQSLAKEKEKKKAGNSNLDKDAFLQLLVAQMKYQDPLEPTSNTDAEYERDTGAFQGILPDRADSTAGCDRQ